MGNCLSGEKENGKTEKTIKTDKGQTQNDSYEENGTEIKILLLGSGESGKSTLFRQISKILQQLNDKEVKTFATNVYENIWRMTKDCVASFQKNFPNGKFKNKESEKAMKVVLTFDEEFGEFKDGFGFTQEVYDSIINLWSDDKFLEYFHKYKGKDFHINDGAEYLFKPENLKRYKPQPEYVPTFEDVIQCRKKTIGISKVKFKAGQKEFIITDVGGQRNERKKWTNAFENVSVVIFVVSLGDYDQTCYEDDVTNRMKEALELFEKIINNGWFKQQKIILLLNKEDILKEKLKKTDLKVCFEDYKGGDLKDAVDFITKKFTDTNQGERDRITVKTIQATSTDTVSRIFNEIKQSLAEQFK